MVDDNRGPWLATATALFLAWSALTFSVRVWAKLRTKNWGSDDYSMLAALAFAIGHSICIFQAVSQGYGRPLDSIADVDRVTVPIYVGQLFYVISTGLSRVSVALFIAYMAHSGPHSKPANALAALSGLWTLVFSFAIAFRGSPKHPWSVLDQTSPMFARWMGVEVSGLVIELALWALSLHLILNLHIQLKKRVFILGAFGLRLLLIPIISCRLAYLSPKRNTNLTTTSVVPNILTEAALHFSILSACLTCFRPFLQSLHPTYVIKSIGATGSTPSGTQDMYYQLELNKRCGNGRTTPREAINWQPYHGVGEGYATAYPAQVHTRSKDRAFHRLGHLVSHSASGLRDLRRVLDDTESARTDISDDMIIQRTTEVSVEFEDIPRHSSPLE